MKLNPPKKFTFWISAILGLVGLVAQIGVAGFLAAYAFWFVFAGLVFLILGLLVKGL